jgi:hypothetical protein
MDGVKSSLCGGVLIDRRPFVEASAVLLRSDGRSAAGVEFPAEMKREVGKARVLNLLLLKVVLADSLCGRECQIET